MRKPIASLSLDLDNLWAYLKTHGNTSWQSYPSYLDVVVPRILEFLESHGLTITFFIVGQDAALERNRRVIGAIAAAGHEIGNHSFQHEPWLHLYSEQQIEAELLAAEESIGLATGQTPVGFRGPGFTLTPVVLSALARRGYLYDATTLPNFLNPLARAYFLMTSNLNSAEKRQRKALFGTFRDGLRSLKPYRWKTDDGEVIEMPVTTVPVLKIPMHASYVLYLSALSPTLAIHYFRTALKLCRVTKTPPSLLLHPLDFLGSDDTQALSFFPGMNMPSRKKLEVVSEIIRTFEDEFTVLTIQQHVREILTSCPLAVVGTEARHCSTGEYEILTDSSPGLLRDNPAGRPGCGR
jgi:hypothetical protein